MDTSARFFVKLRSLALLLETERVNLEHAANPNLPQDDDETESGAVQALHKLHSEVRALKQQVQSQVASQEGGSTELRSFIKACMVLKQRTTEDIERIQRHYVKYGYKPQKCSLTADVNCKNETDARSADGKPEEEVRKEAAEDEEDLIEAPACETPEKIPPPAVDPTRTPQLSDFGLSALHLQRALVNPDMYQDALPVPNVALKPPLLPMTICESQPKTPKCSLRMDEAALTPRLEDFGITESTICFNNDFTMDLFRKKPPKNRQINSTTQQLAQTAPHNLPAAPSCISLGRLSSESTESPEVPVFSTLEIKLNKQPGQSCSVTSGVSYPESPPRPNAATPELPTFETPYINKLVSAKKIGTGNQAVVTEPPGPVLQADEHTQDWCLATPRIRMQFDVEPHTPEMPDMSSITQDIIKINNKNAASTSVHTSTKASFNPAAPGKENRW